VLKSRFGYRTNIPSVSASKGRPKQLSFKDGVNTYSDNDDLKPTELVGAIDARMVKIGRYKTRKGADRYSVPVGEAMSAELTAITGPSVFTVNGSQAIAQKLTVARTERITKAEVRIKSTTSSAGVLLVEYYTDNAGVPSELIGQSSIRPADVTSSFTWLPVYFIQAPAVTAAQVIWQVIRGQDAKCGNYEISTTTASTTALSSATAGAAWSVTTYSANVRLYTAPFSPVKGVQRAYRPNGLKVTTLAYGSSIATVNDSTGATTVIKADFNGAAVKYRSQMVQDAVYYVNGLEKPWKWDFTTFTQLTAAPYIPSLIMEHKGLLFFNDVEDKTRIFYSNFADYATFTITDFIYVPAPKSYDSVTAFGKLNGAFYVFARGNKFVLLGSDNDTFSLDEAPSQRGTFSQESVVFDSNFIYHADGEGVHKFNGTDDINLAEPFLEDYLAINNKDSIQLEVYRNRLYVFYAPAGAADNTECFVINLLLNRFESRDVNTPIGHTFSRYAQDDIFIQASNRVAGIYYGELNTNDYHNLGAPIQYELRTSYSHFDQAGSLKRIPKWRPQFPSVTGDYGVQVGYDKDSEGNPQFQTVSLSGSGARFNTGVLFNTGVRFAGQRMIEPKLHIPGTFNRLQRRYKHIAAREPVELDSEAMSIEVQRLI